MSNVSVLNLRIASSKSKQSLSKASTKDRLSSSSTSPQQREEQTEFHYKYDYSRPSLRVFIISRLSIGSDHVCRFCKLFIGLSLFFHAHKFLYRRRFTLC